MHKNKFKYLVFVIASVMIAAGIVLPPKTILAMVLPAKGAAYYDKLFLGMWCSKIALILNGVFLFLWPRLYSLLWQAEIKTPGTPSLFKKETSCLQKSDYLIMIGIAAIGFLLRVVGINQSLFGDEIVVQQMFIERGLPTILTYFPYTPHHVMYSILAFFSEMLPVPIEISYRLPAVLFGSGTAVLTYLLARNVFLKFEATLIALLTSIAFYGVVYSNVAKSYSTTAFLIVLAVLAIIMIVRDLKKRSGWILFGAAIGSLLYMHIFTAYIVVGLIITLLTVFMSFYLKEKGLLAIVFKRLILVLCTVGLLLFLLYSVQVPQILDQFITRGVHPEEHISLNFFSGWLMQLTFWGSFPPIMYMVLVFAIIGVVSMIKRERVFAILILIPTLVMILIVAITKSFIYPRYLVFSLPFFIISAMEGAAILGKIIFKRRGQRIAAGIFTLIFILPTINVLDKYYNVGFQNIRGACEFIQKTETDEDTIIAYGQARDCFPFYDERIKALKCKEELESLLNQERSGKIYLVYGYSKDLENKTDEFKLINDRFKIIKQFPGMWMDSSQQDGDVFVLESKEVKS